MSKQKQKPIALPDRRELCPRPGCVGTIDFARKRPDGRLRCSRCGHCVRPTP